MNVLEYMRVLRRRWKVLVLTTLLGAAVSALFTVTSTKTYSASTQLFVSSQGLGSDAASVYTGTLSAQLRVKSYAALLTGPELASRVLSDTGLPLTAPQLRSRVTAVAVPDTVLLKVTVTDQSPSRAVVIASSLGTQFSALVEELEDSPTGESAVRVSVVEKPETPTSPISPRPLRNGAAGLVLGGLLGLGLAALRETIDSTIHGGTEASDLIGVPTIGIIAFDDEAVKRPLIDESNPHAPWAEAFRQLRTNLQFVGVDDRPKVIVVTSALPGEGKSTTTSNLAMSFAQADLRVLLIEADLRRPKVADMLGIVGAVGLTDVLVGRVPLDDVVQEWGTQQLFVLPSGPVPPNPAELLGSRSMAALLARVRDEYDIVLIDAPPLLPVTDAAILATISDGTLLVIRAGKTRREQATSAASALAKVDAKLLGVILSMVPAREVTRGYGYGYGYGYAADAVTMSLVPSTVSAGSLVGTAPVEDETSPPTTADAAPEQPDVSQPVSSPGEVPETSDEESALPMAEDVQSDVALTPGAPAPGDHVTASGPVARSSE